jgi:NhaC family Na+:H+ antiporter
MQRHVGTRSARTDSQIQGRKPTLGEALATVLLVAGVVILGIWLQSGLQGVLLPLTLAVGVLGSLSLYLRLPWLHFQSGILSGVGSVSIACLILLLIGALVGVWILGGIIPTLIYYGLQVISPSFFLPTTFLVCLIMSMVTGTAYGTIGTVGVVLIGVQTGFGLGAPITAGAILSGAYFGDKMSPLSDTTNIAAAVGEADLFRHIRSMMFTTLPAAILTFALFWVVGGTPDHLSGEQLGTMQDGLNLGWNIHGLHFIPLILMLMMALKRMPTLMLLFLNVLLGSLWAMVFQKASLGEVFVAATTSFESRTGIQSVDRVLSRGGMESMETVIILVLIAGALGGALRATGVLETLVNGIVTWIRSSGTLIAAVLISCYVVILFTGNQALSLILVGQMFLPVFKKQGIDSTVLTRSLEDSGTLSAPLVPWGVAGGFCSQMLGIPTVRYFPYVWLAFTVPVFSLILGYTGIGVWKAAHPDAKGNSAK